MDDLVNVEHGYLARVVPCQTGSDILEKVGELGFMIDGNESSIGASLRRGARPVVGHWGNATNPETRNAVKRQLMVCF
jgi:hypothetical protein